MGAPFETLPSEPLLSETAFARLARYISAHTGVALRAEAHSSLEVQLHPRLQALGLHDFGDYVTRVLTGDLAERRAVVDAVTGHRPSFFQDAQDFAALTDLVAPALASAPSGIRAWCAWCATGEELWSIVIALAEARERLAGLRFTVLGTDASKEALATAVDAVYSAAAVEALPVPLRHKYLLRKKDGAAVIRVAPELRGHARFESFDLRAVEGERGPMELIFCRGVAAYFEPSARAALIDRLARALVPGGYLFLGPSAPADVNVQTLEALGSGRFRRR